MTYESEVEVRRASVGTKVLGVGAGVLAVLGSFWGVVWFIRSYVEAPRVNAPAPMILASRESIPVPGPTPKTEVKSDAVAAPLLAAPTQSPLAPVTTSAPPPPVQTAAVAAPSAPQFSAPQVSASQVSAPQVSASNAIADRWFSGNQFGLPGIAPPPQAPPPPVAAAPSVEAPPVAEVKPAEIADAEPAIEEVAESSTPAISGPAPLPRRKPVMTAQVKRAEVTPLPRPRPDGPAPQSVWTGVTSSDERFSIQQ
jgi:hypothetical protein